MSGHDWKVLAAFGLLLGGLSLYDEDLATKVGLVAIAVIVVKNAGKVGLGASSPPPAPPGSARPGKAPAPGSTTMQV